MKKKTGLLFLFSLFVFAVLFCIALMVGRHYISFSSFLKVVFTNDLSVETERNIVFKLRLPRTIIAALAGISLSISGLLYQEIFQNKLVSPDLLGVSAGAGVGAAFAIIMNASSAVIGLSAFVSGFFAVLLTLLISKIFRSESSAILLLSGIIVSGFMNGLLSACKYFAGPDTTLSSIIYWLMGSFAYTTMNDVVVMMPVVFVCSVFVLCIRWRINIVALGREEAQAKGMEYVLYRMLLILTATLLTAVTVSFCGTISWIGLVIPHIVRLFVGRNMVKTVPFTITFGSLFMIFTDIVSRTFTADEIPLSAITGILGTVIFVIILYNNRGKIYESGN